MKVGCLDNGFHFYASTIQLFWSTMVISRNILHIFFGYCSLAKFVTGWCSDDKNLYMVLTDML